MAALTGPNSRRREQFDDEDEWEELVNQQKHTQQQPQGERNYQPQSRQHGSILGVVQWGKQLSQLGSCSSSSLVTAAMSGCCWYPTLVLICLPCMAPCIHAPCIHAGGQQQHSGASDGSQASGAESGGGGNILMEDEDAANAATQRLLRGGCRSLNRLVPAQLSILEAVRGCGG